MQLTHCPGLRRKLGSCTYSLRGVCSKGPRAHEAIRVRQVKNQGKRGSTGRGAHHCFVSAYSKQDLAKPWIDSSVLYLRSPRHMPLTFQTLPCSPFPHTVGRLGLQYDGRAHTPSNARCHMR